ncbi:hypothetical protein [Actinomadura harenae]|uniref:hypothetical protein n=1 Tax=Actinomadura harenae TaxID=2483351 RepID=UPI0011C385B8|nr:hypothetical protein [Actinomadura harenae]
MSASKWTAVSDLDRLARQLTATGLSVEAHYGEPLAWLKVYDEAAPRHGETVRVGPGSGADPWFISSTGRPLSPVWDTPFAAQRIAAQIARHHPAAARLGAAAASRDVVRGQGVLKDIRCRLAEAARRIAFPPRTR